MTVSILLCKDIMFQFWLMGSLGPANLTLWAHQGLQSKVTHMQWVSHREIYPFISRYRLMRSPGVIPRAASHLFEALNGGASGSRQNSGLKVPTRYSVASINGAAQSFAKASSDRKWQMTATYVEVCVSRGEK
jgi:hypothetical protein